ncbi:hypothetical protein GY45DRAFT_1320300 [Cubamyces sp. BRFM 1775]|nr:hypothetical protein GY45DRAFT_1320300 [Cubamyces sp. BRFM 1775]
MCRSFPPPAVSGRAAARGHGSFPEAARSGRERCGGSGELLLLDGEYGHPSTDGSMPEISCPYTLFLASISWQTAVESEQHQSMLFSQGILMQETPFGISVSSGLSDSGSSPCSRLRGLSERRWFSVVDVTDPHRPTYCFVTGPDGPDDIFGPAETKPVTAARLLARYERLDRIRAFDPENTGVGCGRTP